MQITSPVTDYIPRSILTTLNDIVLRGAAQPERAPGLLRAIGTDMGYFGRSASGDEVVAGVGFEPSLVIFLAADQTAANRNWSVGVDNGDLAHLMYFYSTGANVGYNTNSSVWIYRTGANHIYGAISATGADGFTVTFTLVGVCAAHVVWCALP